MQFSGPLCRKPSAHGLYFYPKAVSDIPFPHFPYFPSHCGQKKLDAQNDPVAMWVLDPFKTLQRSVFALSRRDSITPDIATHAALSTSMQDMRTDMSDLVQTVEDSRLEVEGALHTLTAMEWSLNALAVNVQALQH
jgi:hypothetical protein